MLLFCGTGGGAIAEEVRRERFGLACAGDAEIFAVLVALKGLVTSGAMSIPSGCQLFLRSSNKREPPA